MLVDSYGRRIRKLRVSLTDQCNLRCHYCMPIHAEFMEVNRYLRPKEYGEIINELVTLGLEEVRLTGGEPLLRQALPEILTTISRCHLKKISLTTNGILLHRYLELLCQHQILDLNISLDSLNPEIFTQITHGRNLRQIQANITLAKQQGFRIKINAVMMRGVNDQELFDFVEYAKHEAVEVRFLELMRIGQACPQQQDQFIAAQELIDRLKTRYTLQAQAMPLDSTAFNFRTDCGASIGFIASESQPFCGHCSRWRLSADGILRACLLKTDGHSIRGLNHEQRFAVYEQLLGMKPYLRPPEVTHLMHQIGG
ncbi:GTP 3',8-cyclase MoaA [Synechococcus sp. PCC 6312]|uniref:GTP 3',8-cyclase MoaA n=1 Tax=Synechococcus sp. (strain ATCC 27167 / PCC 6312) TaxID=195253 RepID=UPI00029F0736|nr:GTP 3',8-cyclase MoaA [Synechococcus sp. PCC 6312]AFY60300.1 molybdenum cofactor biosynthesis protein A [Synechococcus sp. PCC 6312]